MKFIFILFIIVSRESLGKRIAERYVMPDEGDTHTATWMAYGATVETWGTDGSYGASRLIARKDLIRIAANLARFEHVKMLINESDLNEAKEFLKEIKNETYSVYTGGKLLPLIDESGNIEFLNEPVDDLWARDTGPVFVLGHDNISNGINFNFNGWGQENTGAPGWKKSKKKADHGVVDQRITEDKKVADFIIDHIGIIKVSTWLVMEGGGIEVNGKGTAICTESCILNDNRNPGKTKKDVEKELLRLLGVRKIIWLPGLRGMDVTDGHVDFYARFVGDSKVVVTLDNNKDSPDYNDTHVNFEILSSSTDAFGNNITVIPLISPDFNVVKKAVIDRNGWQNNQSFFNTGTFAAGYIGFYLANNCIMMSNFGDDEADTAAFDIISDLYPNRTVMQITADGIANGGGTIHCSTQQQILLSETGISKNAFSLSAVIIPPLTCIIYFLNFLCFI